MLSSTQPKTRLQPNFFYFHFSYKNRLKRSPDFARDAKSTKTRSVSKFFLIYYYYYIDFSYYKNGYTISRLNTFKLVTKV